MNIFQLFDKISSPTTPSEPISHIIVGLGNPGTKYENTRHNAGFMAVDTLAEKYNSPIKKIKFKSLISNTMINGKNCLLMKPSTFMNNSGQAVVEEQLLQIPIENFSSFMTSLTEPSKIRIRRKGSDGGTME